MPIPTNIDRANATVITLPYTGSQVADFAGTAYPLWYKFVATADGTVSVFPYGNPTDYEPACEIYENGGVTGYYNLDTLALIDLPMYFPVTAGNTYFIYCEDGPTATNCTLTLSVQYAQVSQMLAGDFLTNLEVDTDSEFPLAVLNGSTSNTVRRYVQMDTPATTRGQDGLPHGERGVIFNNGRFAYADEQYPNIKIYDKTFALVATITLPAVADGLAFSRVLQRMYAVYDGGATTDIKSYDSTGTELDSWVTTIVSIGHGQSAVNGDETILYYSPGGTSTIKRWDLIGNVALTDLVADTAGYNIEDLMYLENDTILAVFRQDAAPPCDVYVKQFSTAGATLNTYAFGDHWREEFNPPRIGFALNSPASFWICLKPEPGEFAGQGFQTSEFRNITISTGATASSVLHVNYLKGIYIGDVAASPDSLFGSEKAFPLLVAPLDSIEVPDGNLNGPGGLEILRDSGRLVSSVIRRVRITPHVFDKNQRIFTRRLELLTAPGQATTSGQGSNPIITLHVSNDGGETYPIQRTLTTGQLGQYLHRCYTHQLGQARDRVYKFICTDPVTSVWISVDVDIEESLS